MENKKFLLSTGEIIEVPGYMENREVIFLTITLNFRRVFQAIKLE